LRVGGARILGIGGVFQEPRRRPQGAEAEDMPHLMEDHRLQRAVGLERQHVGLVEGHPADHGEIARHPHETRAGLPQNAVLPIDFLDGDEDDQVVERALGLGIVAAGVRRQRLVHVGEIAGHETLPPELGLRESEELSVAVVAEIPDGDVVAAGGGRGSEELHRVAVDVRTFDIRRKGIDAGRSQPPGAHARDSVGAGSLDLAGYRAAPAAGREAHPDARHGNVAAIANLDCRRGRHRGSGKGGLPIPLEHLERGNGGHDLRRRRTHRARRRAHLGGAGRLADEQSARAHRHDFRIVRLPDDRGIRHRIAVLVQDGRRELNILSYGIQGDIGGAQRDLGGNPGLGVSAAAARDDEEQRERPAAVKLPTPWPR
jgi:hypothetical protein